MPKRLTSSEIMRRDGHSTLMDAMSKWCFDLMVPACCEHGCKVKPDDHCEHGHPSVLTAIGAI